MKTKKYQFYNRFLVKDPTAERNFFAFRELKKTACWIMVNPLDNGNGPENNRLDIDQILGDFVRNPTMSEARLRQYLNLVRKQLRNATDNQLPPPGLFMMVTDYSRIVWAVSGDLCMYRVQNGNLKFEGDDWHLLNYLGIKAKPGEVRSDSVYLKDNDLIFLCNAEIGQKISDEFLYRTITDFKDSDESAKKAKQFLIDASQDLDYRMAFISVNKLTKRDFSHDLKDCKRIEVMMPVLLMACFGMLAIYEIECQKMKHALFIPNTIAFHYKQWMARKIKTAIPLPQTGNKGQAGLEAVTIGQPVNNLELTSSGSLEMKPSDEVLSQDVPIVNGEEKATVEEPVAVTNLPPAAKAKLENNPQHLVPVHKTASPVSHTENSVKKPKDVPVGDFQNNELSTNRPLPSENSHEQNEPEIPVFKPDPEFEPDPSNVPIEANPNHLLPEDGSEAPKSNITDYVNNFEPVNKPEINVNSEIQPKTNTSEYTNPEKTGGDSESKDVITIEKEKITETVSEPVTADL